MDKLNEIIENGEYETIEGWCPKDKALKMAHLIKPNDFCVELGVFGGRSLLPMCFMTQNQVIGIDAWSSEASLDGEHLEINNNWWSKIDHDSFYEYTQNLLKKYDCNNVKLIRNQSINVSHLFQEESIDVLHQDSNHSEKISCLEVELYHPKVKKNGYWIFDDTNWETTKKAQDLLVNYGYTEIYDSGSWKIYQKNF